MKESDTPQSQDNTGNGEDNRHNSGLPIVEVPSAITTSPSAPSKHTESDEGKQMTPGWKKLYPYRFGAELAILAVTLYIACIYSRQLSEMVESNRISRNSLYSVQRAFIVYDGVEHDVVNAVIGVQKIVPLGKVFRFYAKWENSGNTPAVKTVQAFGVAARQPGELSEEDFLFHKQREKPTFSASFVGPQTSVISRIQYMPTSFANATEGERYFFGWTYYLDAFSNTKPHVTEFCEHIDTVETGTQKGSDLYRFTLSQCSEHNCVDQFCADYDAVVKRVESNLQHEP